MSVQNRNQDPKMCDYLHEPKRIRFTTFFFSNGHQLGDPRKKRSHKVLFRFTFSPPTSKKSIRIETEGQGCTSLKFATGLVSITLRIFQKRLYSYLGSITEILLNILPFGNIYFQNLFFGTKIILVQARPLNRLFLKFITSFGKQIRVARSGLLVKQNKAAAGIAAMTTHRWCTAGTPSSTVTNCCRGHCGCRHCGCCSRLKQANV